MKALDFATAFWLRETLVLALCAGVGLVLAPAILQRYADTPESWGLYVYAGLVAWASVEVMFSLKRTVLYSRIRALDKQAGL